MTDLATDVLNFAKQQSLGARATAVGSIDDNPDQAARSVDLSNATGVPAPAIYNNLDAFDAQHKAALTGQIISGNQHLQDYVNSDPMAAKVSNDDWGQLDAVSQALQKQGADSVLGSMAKGFANFFSAGVTSLFSGVPQAETQAFASGFDWQGQKAEADRALQFSSNPLWQALVRTVGGPGMAVMRANQGVAQAVAAGAGRLYTNVTGSQIGGDQLMRDLIGVGQILPALGVDATAVPPELNAIAQAAQRSAPYMAHGIEPPVGIDPLIDEAKGLQAKEDATNLKSLMATVAQSATRGRSPETFQKFIAQHIGNDTIGIPADVVQQLYGNKVPSEDDNLLGFVPDMGAQLLRAAVTGGDVQVPMADFLAKVDPALANKLIDSIRVRPDGMTIDEANAAKTAQAEPEVAEPPDQLARRAAGIPSVTDLARSAGGMSKIDAARYEKLIGTQQEAEAALAKRRVIEAERRRQTPEWKANRKEVLDQVIHDVTQDPTFLADQAMRKNVGPKIGAEFLTEDEKAMLPRSAWKQDSSWNPDDLAKLYGHETGEGLVKSLTQLEADRQSQGLSPTQHLAKFINDEADNRMEQLHGDLQQNILESAQEQVVSPTTLDVLHAEIEGLMGGKLPFTRDQMQAKATESVNNSKARTIRSADKFATANRAANEIEKGLLKEDPTTALKWRQRRYQALLEAKQALRIEKAKGQLAKIAKKYRQANVSGARSEYTNHIHSIMTRLGMPVNRSVQGIAQAIQDSNNRSLKSFVEEKEGDLGNQLLNVPEFLLNENFSVRSIDDLTGGQLLDVTQALRSMAHASAAESKVIRSGDKVDIDGVKAEMRERANEIRPEQRPVNKSLPVEVARKGMWHLLTPEALWDRLDLNNPNGIFNQVLNRITVESVNHEDRLLKEYGGKITKLMRGAGNLKKRVENGLFYDQNTGEHLPMTRGGVLGVLQHYGDPWAWHVLTKGYGIDPKAAEAWLFGKINDTDLARAKAIGDLQTEIYDMYRNMARNVSDMEYDKEPPAQITMPNGEVLEGWHHPLRHDPIGDPGAAARQKVELEDKGYFRPERPSNGFTTRRTGYIGQVALDLEAVPIRMKQMLHAVATQPASIQLAKFVNDPKFMQMIEYSQGKAQADMLRQFLHDLVRAPEFRTASTNVVMRGISAVVNNFVGSAVSLSPTTWAKHGGTAFVKSVALHPVGFANELVKLFTTDQATQEINIKMAMSKSDELSRKWVSLTERAYGAQDLISLRTKPSWTNMMQFGGSFPLTFFDMMSSIPLFLTVYKDAIMRGENEGNAVYLADKAVRQTHGSSAISNRPQALRSHNAIANAFTRFYGFYNENFQNLYKAGWQLNDSAKAVKVGDWDTARKNLGAAALGMFTAGMVPSLMEYATTAAAPGTPQRESWERFGVNILTNAPFSSTLGLRDILPAIINREPQTGVAGSIIQDIADPINDLIPDKHGNIRAMTPAKQGQVLRDFILLSSLVTPLRTNMTEANAAEFLWNYYHGHEHPHGPMETLIGLRRGSLKGPHLKSFDAWLNSLVPQ